MNGDETCQLFLGKVMYVFPVSINDDNLHFYLILTLPQRNSGRCAGFSLIHRDKSSLQ